MFSVNRKKRATGKEYVEKNIKIQYWMDNYNHRHHS